MQQLKTKGASTSNSTHADGSRISNRDRKANMIDNFMPSHISRTTGLLPETSQLH